MNADKKYKNYLYSFINNIIIKKGMCKDKAIHNLIILFLSEMNVNDKKKKEDKLILFLRAEE